MAEDATLRPTARVVLRYEDRWIDLLAQLALDRETAMVPSAARALVVALCDASSFVEIGTLARRESRSYDADADVEADSPEPGGIRSEIDVPVDGLVAGWGTIAGRPLFLVADDVALGGPVRGGAAAAKVARVREHALAQGGPIVQVYAATRVPPGLYLGAELVRYGYGLDLLWEVNAAAAIPKVAVVTAPISAQAALEASWAHLTVLTESASIDVGVGPASGDEALRAGLADAVVADAAAAVRLVSAFLDLLPSSRWDAPPAAAPHTPPTGVPAATDEPAAVVAAIVDRGSGIELLPSVAPGTTTILARMAGAAVGAASIAPGNLTADAAMKLERLVRVCDTFRLPLIVVHRGIALPEGAPAEVGAARGLLDALTAATVPIIEVTLDGGPSWRAAGVAVAFTGAWARHAGDDLPPDAEVAPADTRQLVLGALANLAVTRPQAWEMALGKPAVEANLFNRAAE